MAPRNDPATRQPATKVKGSKEGIEEKRGVHLRVPNHLKVAKKVYVPTGNPRGRRKGQTKSSMKPGGEFYVQKTPKGPYVPTGKPRGRKKKVESEDE